MDCGEDYGVGMRGQIQCVFKGSVIRCDVRESKAGRTYLVATVAVGDQYVRVFYFEEDAADKGRAIIPKSSSVGVRGRIELNTWEKDGEKFSQLKAIADTIKVFEEEDAPKKPRGAWNDEDFYPSKILEKRRRGGDSAAAAAIGGRDDS